MKTTSELPQVEAYSREMLAAAEDNFRGVMAALIEIRRRLEAGEGDFSETDLRRTLAGVHRSIQAVFDERKKLDDIRQADTGLVAGQILDLGKAEEHVRSRISRIRAELHGDEIPPVAG